VGPVYPATPLLLPGGQGGPTQTMSSAGVRCSNDSAETREDDRRPHDSKARGRRQWRHWQTLLILHIARRPRLDRYHDCTILEAVSFYLLVLL
jgi:hypothetical protein